MRSEHGCGLGDAGVTLTIACLTGLAMESHGFDQRINHDTCKQRGGVIYQRPDGLTGSVQVKPCDCACHAGQERRWIPTPKDERYWWRKPVQGVVRLAL